MGIFKVCKKVIKEHWNKLDRYEKTKLILRGVCNIGSGFLIGQFITDYAEKCELGAVEMITVGTVAYGGGIWVANTAADQLDDLVDAVKGIREGAEAFEAQYEPEIVMEEL